MIEANISQADLQHALKDMKKYDEGVQKKVRAVITASAFNVNLGAKQRCPVNTTPVQSGSKDKKGRSIGNTLRGSIKVYDRHIDRFNLKVGTDVKYAPYIEFGTGAKVKVPEGLEDYAMQFKGAGIRQVNIRPQPYLFPAAEAERKHFESNIAKALQP